ncbi:MAG: prepilin-type N-terminal cleavage/methylation domain-containing protein [Woeseiaceae bacterium]|nr:prepilin-type N-terminal cleavage/methylation domain-containing protein [Woeseiaceae bacterium]
MCPRCRQSGFTLSELLTALALTALILAATTGFVNSALGTSSAVAERNTLLREARFALDRIVSATSHSPKLLLPLPDNPATNWPENVRAQTIPASPPIGNSTFASAVLAVTLPEHIDLDADGFPDADDDRDGRINEDFSNDAQHDFQAGIMLIDDDGDGSVDEGTDAADDDEDGVSDEDLVDGIDNDGDGSIDEDPPSDNNGDACPGLCGVDDDRDGTIDDGGTGDDDEDGSDFEDGYDPVVFYLEGNALMERMPVPWNADGNSSPDGPNDGRDFVAAVIAVNVTSLRFERLEAATGPLVQVDLEVTGPSGVTVSLSARTRVGGAL